MKFLVVILLLISYSVCSLQQQEFQEDEEQVQTTTEGNAENGSAEGTTTENGEGEDSDEDGLQSNDPNLVGFYLYPSSENTSYEEVIRIGESETLLESSYSPSKTPIFIIHGFVNNYTTKYSQSVKNAFLEGDFGEKHNIIVVDWGALATPKNPNLGNSAMNDWSKNPFYRAAVQNVPKVGRRIMEFLDFLMNEDYLDSPTDVYLIGFSLGAQVAGTCGYEVRQNMTTPLGRITGLDPAGPLYQSQTNNALKLDAGDADFVDIVHTNSGQSGYEGNIGHADFYPNGGGPNQNDCLTVGAETISNAAGVCAHNRCWVYYIKALTTEVHACKCVARPDYWCKAMCSNKVLFGYACTPNARGTYYLDIKGKEPQQQQNADNVDGSENNSTSQYV